MLVSERYKFVYLANPKTGTTSIEAAFKQYADFAAIGGPSVKHIPFKRFRRLFPYYATNFEVLVTVRDPIETLYSWYRYRQRDDLSKAENSTAGLSFGEFLEAWAQDTPPPYARIGTSVEFILNGKGEIPDISVFRYDGTPSLHDYLAAKIGKKIDVKSLNVSPKGNGENLEAHRKRVADLPKLARAYDIYSKIPYKNA